MFVKQTYPHKILTGRRSKMHTIRQTSGLAGFTKRSESEYDPFGAGHSSTTISAGLGNCTLTVSCLHTNSCMFALELDATAREPLSLVLKMYKIRLSQMVKPSIQQQIRI